jgi:hypothetical protein
MRPALLVPLPSVSISISCIDQLFAPLLPGRRSIPAAGVDLGIDLQDGDIELNHSETRRLYYQNCRHDINPSPGDSRMVNLFDCFIVKIILLGIANNIPKVLSLNASRQDRDLESRRTLSLEYEA